MHWSPSMHKACYTVVTYHVTSKSESRANPTTHISLHDKGKVMGRTCMYQLWVVTCYPTCGYTVQGVVGGGGGGWRVSEQLDVPLWSPIAIRWGVGPSGSAGGVGRWVGSVSSRSEKAHRQDIIYLLGRWHSSWTAWLEGNRLGL